jgi:hypothetical protein
VHTFLFLCISYSCVSKIGGRNKIINNKIAAAPNSYGLGIRLGSVYISIPAFLLNKIINNNNFIPMFFLNKIN